jgi:ABC-type transporter Mla maintaining outer membrane lipid asymmetry ATPase subunit MlaF
LKIAGWHEPVPGQPQTVTRPARLSEIDELLMKVKTERHTTVVVVTHDIRGARRIGDHFAILDRGDLVGYGTASELEKSENKLVREFISEA